MSCSDSVQSSPTEHPRARPCRKCWAPSWVPELAQASAWGPAWYLPVPPAASEQAWSGADGLSGSAVRWGRLYGVGLSNARRVHLTCSGRVVLGRGDRGRGGRSGDDVLSLRGGHGAGGYGFVPFAAATAAAGGEHHAQCGGGAGGAKDEGMSGCHVSSPGCNVLHKMDHGGIIFLALGGARCFGQKASVAAGRGVLSVVRQLRRLPQGGGGREFVAPLNPSRRACDRGRAAGRRGGFPGGWR